MDSVSIGLDIGSTAVRAAELNVEQGRHSVRKFGQVGLPHGAVVDGEIVNPIAVTEALRRLWSEAGFSSNKVVLGVSGPRVFVRQADVPVLSDEDLRSSLRFDGQELVPIPLDEASFDFSVLERPDGGGGGDTAPSMRILLVAAHQDVLRSQLAVLKGAGLEAVAMDSSSLALLRAIPTDPGPSGGGVEVVVSIGAELTTVAVRQDGVPRFIRTLTMGGSRLTQSIANTLHVDAPVAERMKRMAVADRNPQTAQLRRAMATDVRDLAEDIRATVDFFLSQSDDQTIERLLITGGASQTEGLAQAIGGNLPVQVLRVAPFAGLSADGLALASEALDRAGSSAATAVGLALWPVGPAAIRLSILPEEVARARHARRLFQAAACGLAGLAGVLAVAGTLQVMRVQKAESQARDSQAQVTALTGQVNRLESETAVHGKALARAKLDRAALTGDVDWVRLLGQLAGVMPPNLHLLTFSGTRGTGARSAGSSTAPAVGAVTFDVQGSGDANLVADWLEALHRDPAFQGTWVGGLSITNSPGGKSVSFSSTATLTPKAESGRDKAVQP